MIAVYKQSFMLCYVYKQSFPVHFDSHLLLYNMTKCDFVPESHIKMILEYQKYSIFKFDFKETFINW